MKANSYGIFEFAVVAEYPSDFYLLDPQVQNKEVQ